VQRPTAATASTATATATATAAAAIVTNADFVASFEDGCKVVGDAARYFLSGEGGFRALKSGRVATLNSSWRRLGCVGKWGVGVRMVLL
jgi:hypothetical protein